MERFRCEAVVLSVVDYGDADKVVTLLSRERGRLAAFAIGARKSKRRFAGVLEPFTRLTADLVETRGDTYRLDRAEMLDGFAELRTDIGRIARASYACELLRELCKEREEHPELFDLLCRYLSALARENAGPLATMRFELLVLGEAGLMPRLDSCVRCGREAGEHDVFDPDQGGLLCPSCVPEQAYGTRSAAEAARALSLLQNARPGTSLEISASVRAQARALLTQFVSHHLGKRLKSLEFMRDVGVEP